MTFLSLQIFSIFRIGALLPFLPPGIASASFSPGLL
jgi:hypothetical protein